MGEAFSAVGQAGRDSLHAARDVAYALHRLVQADLTQARLSLLRAGLWLVVVAIFGASAWLLLMLSLLLGLHALGLSWLAAASTCALCSVLITLLGMWQVVRYLRLGQLSTSRAQLAHFTPTVNDAETDDDTHSPSLSQAQRRLARINAVVDRRRTGLQDNLQQVQTRWIAAWTPWRILGAGLGLGFVSGKLDPEAAASGLAGRLGAAPKVLETLAALSSLVAAARASASENADTDDSMETPDDTPPAAGMARTAPTATHNAPPSP